MFNLDVISVNIWQILASLANLLILTWILKRFLFKPVKKMLDNRRAAIDADYAAAAQQTSDQMISDATRMAEHRSSEIVAEAREKATDIRRQAEADALLERKKAEDDMKREIADVSARLTGKLLQREINEEDHRALIDSFLQEIGTDNDNN